MSKQQFYHYIPMISPLYSHDMYIILSQSEHIKYHKITRKEIFTKLMHIYQILFPPKSSKIYTITRLGNSIHGSKMLPVARREYVLFIFVLWFEKNNSCAPSIHHKKTASVLSFFFCSANASSRSAADTLIHLTKNQCKLQ